MASNSHIAPDPALLRRYRWLDWLSPGAAIVLVLLMALWQSGPVLFGKAWPSTWTMSGATRQILMFAFMWIALSSSWNLVGGYAFQPTWGDGHNTGLYPFEYLRRIDPSRPA